jgi:hypothetical protein
MKIVAEPTPEIYEAPINGVLVPVRVWRGLTEGGVELEVLVLSIIPKNDEEHVRLKEELPTYKAPSRDVFHVDLSPEASEQH